MSLEILYTTVELQQHRIGQSAAVLKLAEELIIPSNG